MYSDWFDFGAFDIALPATKDAAAGRGGKAFNGFEPDFVYRYRLMPDLTVRQLAEWSEAVLRRAKAW